MVTFGELLTDVEKGPVVLQAVLNILTKAGADLPLIIKTLSDFQMLAADEKDPVKLLADLEVIAPDITADLNALVSLWAAGTITTTTTTVPVTPPQAAA